MCNCCCDSANKKCYQTLIILFSFFILAFQIAMVALFRNSIDPDDIESFIDSETPLYNFEPTERELGSKKNITFFEFKGRTKKVGNNTITYDEKSFTKIFNHKFFYEAKDKNYFKYKNEYSVIDGNNCPENYKPCGILDSSNRILCLKNDEDCPLNGFGISIIENDPKYEGYETKEVLDSNDFTVYYLYYTNNNVEGHVITEFKLSHGTPCAKVSEKNWIKFYSNEVEENYKCKTEINGNVYNTRYIKVSDEGINIRSLYADNGLRDSSNFANTQNAKVDLYIRNYNDIDEKCFEDFLEELKDEEKFYDSAVSAVRALGSISIILNFVLFIFITVMCCRDIQFSSFSFIVPIYGIICNVIVLGIINKSRVRYKCQLEGFNEEIDELLDEQYDNNKTNTTIMSALSLAFYALDLILLLCLKFMRSRNIGVYGTTTVPVPVVPVQAVGVYPQPYPTPYGANMAYPNMMAVPPASYGVPYS